MEPIGPEEQQEMRDVLQRFYGSEVQGWTITYEMYEMLGELMQKSGGCTRVMHFVPRPWDFSNPIKWAQKQVRQAITRYLKTPEGQHYISCMRAAAIGMKSRFVVAASGA